jgi:alkyl sulfatase BDS1-like metallo-beta-lactamase superfamily hydrolase
VGQSAFIHVSFAVAILLLAACGSDAPSNTAPLSGRDVHAELAAHSAEFERAVYRVTDRVHQAVGFGLANSILVEGDDCVFIVDTMGSVESARRVKSAFEKITTKPIRALIYTHNHADHVFGGRGFVPDGDVDVYAHATTERYIDRVVNIIRPIITKRSARMFGTYLPAAGPDAVVNDGIGPFLEINAAEGSTLGLIRPTQTFDRELDLSLCGQRVKLIHAPGETDDQIFVWLPDERLLMPGDNIYKAFPNLYTIRGTAYRNPLQWVQSLDRMRELAPEHLVPSHTRSLSGAAQISETLTAYRDAIQFVHDQTIRGMNQGMTPDELVGAVALPRHLAEHPYLQEFYGTVAWSVRSIYSGYLGWFDGDSATLSPANPEQRALGFAALAGGTEPLLAATSEAIEREQFAWAAELATQLMRVAPGRPEPIALKARALRALGQRSISPNARNYYLTQARELEGDVHLQSDLEFDAGVRALISSIPIRNFMAAMPTHLLPEKSIDTELIVGFHFTDVDEFYTIHIRRGVAEFQPRSPNDPDVSIATESDVWREVVTGQRKAALAVASGAIRIDGGKLALVRLLGMFSG